MLLKSFLTVDLAHFSTIRKSQQQFWILLKWFLATFSTSKTTYHLTKNHPFGFSCHGFYHTWDKHGYFEGQTCKFLKENLPSKILYHQNMWHLHNNFEAPILYSNTTLATSETTYRYYQKPLFAKHGMVLCWTCGAYLYILEGDKRF